jgi:hypothetical protein
MQGGNVKNTAKFQTVGALALLCAGLLAGGCKSGPELTQANALSLIQAKYDQSPGVTTDIVVKDLGMRQGVTAKYWEGVRRYPNGYWADFKLTDDGKKLVKLPQGGDTIEWRPNGPNDLDYSITLTTIATSHSRARNVQDIQDMSGGKVATYTEDENLDGLPGPLQDMAHDPGNELSTQKQANFVLANGAWTLQSIQ